MILAQVCLPLPFTVTTCSLILSFLSQFLPARFAIHLHSLPSPNKSGILRSQDSSSIVLAVEYLCAVYRVFGWIYVRILSRTICIPLPLTLPFYRLCQAIIFLIFNHSEIYVAILGFFALGLESTLPIPQLIRSVVPNPFFLQALQLT
jgi:hypothetical protein